MVCVHSSPGTSLQTQTHKVDSQPILQSLVDSSVSFGCLSERCCRQIYRSPRKGWPRHREGKQLCSSAGDNSCLYTASCTSYPTDADSCAQRIQEDRSRRPLLQPPYSLLRSCTLNNSDAPGSLRPCRLHSRHADCISDFVQRISHCRRHIHCLSIHSLLVLIQIWKKFLGILLLPFVIWTFSLLMNWCPSPVCSPEHQYSRHFLYKRLVLLLFNKGIVSKREWQHFIG